MATSRPSPPQGYDLVPRDASVPSFIREAVGPVKEQLAPRLKYETPGTETVAEAHPGVISIYDKNQYTPAVRNHEMTHEFQDTRENGNIKLPFGYEIQIGSSDPSTPLSYEKGNLSNYDYGGEAGLAKMRNSGKTVADLNPEQQADMVSDYKAKQDAYLAKVKAGKATPSDLHQMYQTYEVYHPFIQQMVDVPKNLRDMLPSVRTLLGIGKPTPLAPAPHAPGLPPYDTPGLSVAPADPLMGGSSVFWPVTYRLQKIADDYRNVATQ